MKYKFILFDADDTILDFQASAKLAFKYTSEQFNLPYTLDLYEDYRKINQELWDKHSMGLIEKKDLLVDRFKLYAKKQNFDIDATSFNGIYHNTLKNYGILLPNSLETLKAVKNLGLKIYVITNGTKLAQRSRLAISKLIDIFDDVFISEEVGYTKPDINFFNAVINKIGCNDISKYLIVGDSIISDIQGGINAQIDTCLFNPNNQEIDKNIKINYVINDIRDVVKVIESEV